MKILILRVSAIGDVIHSLPAMFLLKNKFLNAQISWIVQEKAASLLKNQNFLENLWILPDKFLYPKNISKTLSILREIRKEKWDAIIDFQGILKTSFLLSFIKGKKFGFDSKNCKQPISSFFTNFKTSPNYQNIIQKNLALAEFVTLFKGFKPFLNPEFTNKTPSIEALRKEFYLNISGEEKNIVDKYLAEKNLTKFIILSPNTTWNSKFWPYENWASLINMLSEKLNNYKIVILGEHFGGPAKKLLDDAKKRNVEIYSPPKLNLLSTAHIISKSSLIIAPDTGILHLSDFIGCKAIGIFGPTSKTIHGPFLTRSNKTNAIQIDCPHKYQKNHYFLEKTDPKKNCMYQLSAESLLEKIAKILKK